ncbi:hypothetical protein CGMCC3_g6510 [Colletotrichum fructicola]|uniref:Uncharacterized protein n=1 Tax=Colletotrichum fructicola (strain Nara gc5) TaxID=1213859 RepID=A0A7J6JEU4_COLFN|nr:uncharacterized protein CGMCC3_g6510 [Colletotrichum fructicola]KAE9577585.1 hypothetical protein CGMCC3_g6510 [Colletotrichum fructicola]KAF4411663.1 hypothetical protein CFRS1_v002141 [Colletotrichum fructicola]KAF4488590.1 hypothetical protein CGGC5_v003641 [Colletotrichum fructicola Nara gc5]KAF4906042.1 hypothetical protein CGCFRS4_v000013 [Colletotrichum fructicola]
MLSIRDENAVNAAQAARLAPGKSQMAPKTPGARYPKTPLKIPLNDENAVNAGKSVLAPKSNANGPIQGTAKKQNLVTPSETRARAPLGNKTTNAKAKSTQNTGVKDIVKDFEKTQTKPTTTKKLKQRSPGAAPLKLEVRNDQAGPADEPDVEYAPPPAKDLPYQSDIIEGDLTFEGLKPENLLKGYYNHFYNPMGEDGVRLQDRQQQQKLKKALKETDDRILRDIQEMDWSVADVPETAAFGRRKAPAPAPNPAVAKKTVGGKYPPTIASRRAASALSMATGSTIKQRKPVEPTTTARRPLSSIIPRTRPARAALASKSSNAESAVGEAASRSTIGYNKGRSASSFVSGRARPAAGARPASMDVTTLVPRKTVVRREASPKKPDGHAEDAEELGRLQFLSIFDPAGDDENDVLGNAGPKNEDFEDDEFEMNLNL